LYHYYIDPRRNKVHLPDVEKKRKISLQRLFYVLEINTYLPENDKALIDVDKYPMGSFRSLETYWEYSGINFEDKEKSNKRWCSINEKQEIATIHLQDTLRYPKNLKKLPQL
jgi:hypothetical protein